MRQQLVHVSMPCIIFLGLAAVLVFVRQAHAYLDPGTGSIMLQVLVGGLLAGFYVLRNKVKWWVSRIWRRKSKS